jgi:hypothetical protein
MSDWDFPPGVFQGLIDREFFGEGETEEQEPDYEPDWLRDDDQD